MRNSVGTRPGYLNLHVLDSTVPASVAAVEASIDLEQRIYHLLALPPECSMVCEEEAIYTLFTLAQVRGEVWC